MDVIADVYYIQALRDFRNSLPDCITSPGLYPIKTCENAGRRLANVSGDSDSNLDKVHALDASLDELFDTAECFVKVSYSPTDRGTTL